MEKHYSEPEHQKHLLLLIQEILPYLHHGHSNSNSQNSVNEEYIQMLSEYLRRVESTIQGADSINNDCIRLNSERQLLETKITEIREKLSKLNETSFNNTKLIENLAETYMDLKKLIDEIQSKSVIGPALMDADDTYTWKINILVLLNDTTQTTYSGPFQCSQWGYRLGMSMTLQMDDQNIQRNVVVSVVFFRGDYDAILDWPFSYPMALCLIDLAGAQNHIVHSVLPDSRTAIYGRPLNNANVPLQITQFCPLEKLVENGTNYVRDGNMFLRLHIDFTKKGVHPFQSKGSFTEPTNTIQNKTRSTISTNKS